MNKEQFRTTFSGDSIPTYSCPGCTKGTLAKISFASESTAAAQRNIEQGCSEGWWEPEHDELIFRMELKCHACDNLVLAHGDGYVEEEHEVDVNGNWERHWVSYHRPRSFFPPLKFIECPSATPREVEGHLGVAASLYHSSPAASCNSLRMAVEEILNSLGVDESTKTKYIPLAERIKKLPADSNEYALLDAIRWLGNDGSHSNSQINHADVEGAFSIMDLLVEDLYSDRKRKIQELAQKIRESKGPVR